MVGFEIHSMWFGFSFFNGIVKFGTKKISELVSEKLVSKRLGTGLVQIFGYCQTHCMYYLWTGYRDCAIKMQSGGGGGKDPEEVMICNLDKPISTPLKIDSLPRLNLGISPINHCGSVQQSGDLELTWTCFTRCERTPWTTLRFSRSWEIQPWGWFWSRCRLTLR